MIGYNNLIKFEINLYLPVKIATSGKMHSDIPIPLKEIA